MLSNGVLGMVVLLLVVNVRLGQIAGLHMGNGNWRVLCRVVCARVGRVCPIHDAGGWS